MSLLRSPLWYLKLSSQENFTNFCSQSSGHFRDCKRLDSPLCVHTIKMTEGLSTVSLELPKFQVRGTNPDMSAHLQYIKILKRISLFNAAIQFTIAVSGYLLNPLTLSISSN